MWVDVSVRVHVFVYAGVLGLYAKKTHLTVIYRVVVIV